MAINNHDTETKYGFRHGVSEFLDKAIYVSLVALIPLIAILYGSIDPLPETIFGSIVFISGAFWFLQGLLCGKLFVRRHFVLLPFIAIILYAVLQAIPFGQIETADAAIKASRTISQDPYETWHVVIRFSTYALYAAMLLRFVSNEKRLRVLVYVIILTAALSALFGFYLQTTVRNMPDSFLPRIYTTRGFAQFINKNNFADLMLLAVGLCAGFLTVYGIRKKVFIFYAAGLLVIVAGLVLSLSRGGLFGFLVQSLCVGLLIAFSGLRKDENEKPKIVSLLVRVSIAFVFLCALVIGILWFGGEGLMSKLETTQSGFSVGQIEQNVSRKQIWQATWNLFKDNPITGVGFGGYWIGVTNYDDTSGNMLLLQAHNDYLELLASGGIIGFILFLWLIFSIGNAARENLFSKNKLVRAFCIGALVGCLGLAVHSFFDFGLHTPIIAFVFTALLCIAVYDEKTETVHLPKTALVVIAIVGVCFSFFISYINLKRGSGRVISETAGTFSKAKNDDPKSFLELAQRAIESAPNDPETHAAMALVLERIGDDSAAVKFYEQAISFRPRDYSLWMRLGRAHEHAGDIEKAIVAFREAVKLAQPYARPKWLLGNALLRSGKQEEALIELKKAMTRDPLLIRQVMPIAWNVLGKDTSAFLKFLNPKSDDEKFFVGKFLIEAGKGKEGTELLISAGEKGKEETDKLIIELLGANRFREAREIWSKASGNNQLISNGSFETDINLDEKMFGWRVVQKVEGVNVSLETKAAHDGQRAILVIYNGNADFSLSPIKQLVAVNPNSKYHLSFAFKSKEIVSGGTPVVVVQDAITNKEIASSKALPASTSDWEKIEFEFTVDAKTEAVFISLNRQTCTSSPCPIFGKVWLDSFELKPN